jgi:hypothetical protein
MARRAVGLLLSRRLGPDMIERFRVKFGEPLPGYRFKPGECVVDSYYAEEYRQGKCPLEELKMVVLAVGTDDRTGLESYFLFYDSTVNGGRDLPWEQMEHWYTKIFVESNFELFDHLAI